MVNSIRGRIAEHLREAILNDLAHNEFREDSVAAPGMAFGFTAIRPSCRDTFYRLRETRSRRAQFVECADGAVCAWNSSDGQAAHPAPIALAPPRVGEG